MLRNYAITAILLFTIGGTSACVSTKKFRQAESTISALRNRNSELNDDISLMKERLALMEEANKDAVGQLDDKERKLQMSADELARKQEQLQQLQALIDRQKAQTEGLRKKMTDALGGFNSDQLSVHTKNGKVYVSISEKLLFQSGSSVVNKEAQEALQVLAKTLNENPDININVEGHTDSIPIRIKFEDNWALSVARSTAIIRLLTHEYQIDPTRITASGRSQYEPIADNANPEGRAQNRRTEIILAPKLDELMQLIGETQN